MGIAFCRSAVVVRANLVVVVRERNSIQWKLKRSLKFPMRNIGALRDEGETRRRVQESDMNGARAHRERRNDDDDDDDLLDKKRGGIITSLSALHL